jgi:hypothetical protein
MEGEAFDPGPGRLYLFGTSFCNAGAGSCAPVPKKLKAFGIESGGDRHCCSLFDEVKFVEQAAAGPIHFFPNEAWRVQPRKTEKRL